jgi:alkyl hydroperoxide reductase subunit AhpC
MNLIGHPAPLFDTPAFTSDQKHSSVSLEDLRGKWVLLFFYPLDFTFVCPTEIRELQNQIEDFKKLNCEVLTVSVDSTYSHEAWCKAELGKVDFSMLSDITKRMGRDYGVLDENSGLALRGTHIIDPEGLVQYSLCNNMKVGRNIPEILRTLEALQTGEACFANWKKS